MRRLLAILGVALLAGCTTLPVADTIFIGGSVYTMDPDNAQASALAVRNGLLLHVGDESGVRRYQGVATRVIDLDGATVFPGFTDAHMHLEGVGARARRLDLVGTTGVGDLLRRLRERIDATPAGQWIVGRGWIETHWEPEVFPTRYDLDTVSSEHPVILRRADGHAAVVNSRALELAGITATTQDPPGGLILRDAAGAPTGMLIDHAIDRVADQLPSATDAQLRAELMSGARTYCERGWTGVQVAGSSAASIERMEARVRADPPLPLRLYVALLYDGPDTEGLAALLESGPRVDRRLTVRSIKVLYDGALGSRGAALLDPYRDAEGRGLLLHDDAELRTLFRRARDAGVQVQVHAIGDRANRRILDLFGQVLEGRPAALDDAGNPRWRIEHAQIIHPTDLPRFGARGVIASMQPSHAIGDLHFAPDRLGPERLAGAYAWRSLLDSGALIAGGSDAPVEVGDPRIEFYAAVARRDLQGRSLEGWHPEQRVTRQQALRMFTLAPAIGAFEEGWRGSLQAGKVCDLTVFDRDLMTCDEALIPGARCLLTVIDGEIVFSRLPGAPAAEARER